MLDSVLGLVVAAALATGVSAQPVQEEQVGTALTGEVTAIDTSARSVTLRSAAGETSVFGVDEETTFMSGDREVSLQQLHTGEWIAVDADRRGEKLVATYVEVVEDPNPGKSPVGSTQATAAGATIIVGHNRLEPALVQIGAGQTVSFRNVDKMPGGHTVVADDGSFSSPALDLNQVWVNSFDVPGVYEVHIKEHPTARASIVVE